MAPFNTLIRLTCPSLIVLLPLIIIISGVAPSTGHFPLLHGDEPPDDDDPFFRSYPAPAHYPFNPHRLVMETVPDTCNIFRDPFVCEQWSRGVSANFEVHNREAMASILHNCMYREKEWIRRLQMEHRAPKAKKTGYFARGSRKNMKPAEILSLSRTFEDWASASPCLVVDIGANIGHFTGLAASLGAYVFAVEPTHLFATAIKESTQPSVNPDWERRVRIEHGFAATDPAMRHVVKKVLNSKYRKTDHLKGERKRKLLAERMKTDFSISESSEANLTEQLWYRRAQLNVDTLDVNATPGECFDATCGSEDVVWVTDKVEAVMADDTYYGDTTSDGWPLYACQRAHNVSHVVLQEQIPQAFMEMIRSNMKTFLSAEELNRVDGSVSIPSESLTQRFLFPTLGSDRSRKHPIPLTLVKIDTDSQLQADFLRLFLDYQEQGLWDIYAFLFEGQKINEWDLRRMQQSNYTLYRLNAHIGYRIFDGSGADVLSDFKPTPVISGVGLWADEVFGQRMIRNALKVKPNAPLPLLKMVAWPRRLFNSLAHFLAVKEAVPEPPIQGHDAEKSGEESGDEKRSSGVPRNQRSGMQDKETEKISDEQLLKWAAEERQEKRDKEYMWNTRQEYRDRTMREHDELELLQPSQEVFFNGKRINPVSMTPLPPEETYIINTTTGIALPMSEAREHSYHLRRMDPLVESPSKDSTNSEGGHLTTSAFQDRFGIVAGTADFLVHPVEVHSNPWKITHPPTVLSWQNTGAWEKKEALGGRAAKHNANGALHPKINTNIYEQVDYWTGGGMGNPHADHFLWDMVQSVLVERITLENAQNLYTTFVRRSGIHLLINNMSARKDEIAWKGSSNVCGDEPNNSSSTSLEIGSAASQLKIDSERGCRSVVTLKLNFGQYTLRSKDWPDVNSFMMHAEGLMRARAQWVIQNYVPVQSGLGPTRKIYYIRRRLGPDGLPIFPAQLCPHSNEAVVKKQRWVLKKGLTMIDRLEVETTQPPNGTVAKHYRAVTRRKQRLAAARKLAS